LVLIKQVFILDFFRFYTCKNAIILFLQCYRLSAIYAEAAKLQNVSNAAMETKADALVSLKAAGVQLDKYVVLAYKEDLLLRKLEETTGQESELSNNRKPFELNQIVLKSSLSKEHSYAVIVTSNSSGFVTCCQCECHPKESLN
jgi:hypothetical protein